MQKILKQIRKADTDFSLIHDGDTILLGLSGGKDSMLLLKALSIYQKFKHKQFSLIALHMDMGFSNEVSSEMEIFCKQEGIRYIVEKTPIYEILKHYRKNNESIDCSRCSSLKRGAIVSYAKKYKANKIAFAHHIDDAIETLFMNMIYGGKLHVFAPKINYEDNEVTFIRPLIYTKEKDIVSACRRYNIPIVKSACPSDRVSNREQIKQTLHSLYKQYPMGEKNFQSILFEQHVQLWKKET